MVWNGIWGKRVYVSSRSDAEVMLIGPLSLKVNVAGKDAIEIQLLSGYMKTADAAEKVNKGEVRAGHLKGHKWLPSRRTGCLPSLYNSGESKPRCRKSKRSLLDAPPLPLFAAGGDYPVAN